VEDAGGFEQAGRHNGARRVGRRHLVDEQTAGQGLVEVDRNQLLALLDHGPKGVVVTIVSLQGQGPGFPRPDPGDRRQAAREGPQVQNGQRDASGVEVPVAVAPEPPADGARPVAGAHGNGVWRGGSDNGVRPRQGGQGREDEKDEKGGASAMPVGHG